MKIKKNAVNRNSKRPRGAVLKSAVAKKDVSLTDIFNEKLLLIKRKFNELNRVKAFNIFNAFLVLMVLAICYGFAGYLEDNMFIEKVVVKGDFVQIDKKEIEEHLATMVGSNYFDININNIQQRLKEFPWLESAEVRRVWPDVLLVEIKEHQVIATWGEDGFVNDKGEIFSAAKVNRDYLKNIPDLNGNKKQSEIILNTYVMLANYSKREKLKINRFSLSSNSYWILGFHNGIELLLAVGREEESLLTFLEIYRKEGFLIDDKEVRIDMRYSNGFSLGLVSLDGYVKCNSDLHSIYRLGNNHG